MSVTERRWGDHTRAELKRAGLRAGGARSAVVGFLAEQECCVSAQELFDGLRAAGSAVSISSVYRSLEQLAELELVYRVDLGGVSRFEPALPGGEHHHHLVCDGCGAVEIFADPELESAIERVADEHGFALGAHEVALRGSCKACRAELTEVV